VGWREKEDTRGVRRLTPRLGIYTHVARKGRLAFAVRSNCWTN
jgi:hypothetical protein